MIFDFYISASFINGKQKAFRTEKYVNFKIKNAWAYKKKKDFKECWGDRLKFTIRQVHTAQIKFLELIFIKNYL